MSKLDRMLEGMKDYEPDKKGVDEEMKKKKKELLLREMKELLK